MTVQGVLLRFCAEEMTSLEELEVREVGEEPEGEGTGSTELSEMRLLGRCGRQKEGHIPPPLTACKKIFQQEYKCALLLIAHH